jgi:hypothetical protein
VTYNNVTSTTCNITAGEDIILRWDITGADSVFIDNGIGNVEENGILTLAPSSSKIYILTAVNTSGTVSRMITVNVEEISLPSIDTFTLSTNPVMKGESSTLEWLVSGATNISIDQNIGPVSNSGLEVVSPSSDTVYTITAENGAGTTSASIMLYVTPYTQPEIIQFTASPAYIKSGQAATLQWEVSGAQSVSISNVGIVPQSGTIDVSPAETTTYILTAYNSAGSITGHATVTVTN